GQPAKIQFHYARNVAMRNRLFHLLIVMVALVAPSANLLAQGGQAELYGTIRDASGLPVPGAHVEAEERATAARFAALSSERGEYHLLGLPAGEYALSVQQSGFRPFHQSGIRLRIADRTELTVDLEIGQQSQAVDVHAEAPLLQTATA